MKIGYARISTPYQKLDLQIDALKKAGCEKIITDTMTGCTVQRPGWQELNNILRPGDTLVVYKLDRLGRPVRYLAPYVADLGDRNIHFISLSNAIDTTTATGRFTFHIMCAFAEMERDLIAERTRTGLIAARARGKKGGPTQKLTSGQVQALLHMYHSRNHTAKEIGNTFNISRATVYVYLNKYKITDR